MNKHKLMGRIVAAGESQKTLACRLGMNANTLNRKLCGRNEFLASEISAISVALSIDDPSEVVDIFLK